MDILSEEEREIYKFLFELYKKVHQHSFRARGVIEHINGYLDPSLSPLQIESVSPLKKIKY